MILILSSCILVAIHIALVHSNPGGDLVAQLVDKLNHAKTVAQSTIDAIYLEWEVDKYPKFLKSCFMNKISWELLSLKYQKKIMEAYLQRDRPSMFVISFTGRLVGR